MDFISARIKSETEHECRGKWEGMITVEWWRRMRRVSDNDFLGGHVESSLLPLQQLLVAPEESDRVLVTGVAMRVELHRGQPLALVELEVLVESLAEELGRVQLLWLRSRILHIQMHTTCPPAFSSSLTHPDYFQIVTLFSVLFSFLKQKAPPFWPKNLPYLRLSTESLDKVLKMNNPKS